ncbi:MAG: hypothetical protein ACTTJH_08410 [Bacteroidales bacterium]
MSKKLKHKDIIDDVITPKTNDAILINLNSYAKQIIEKYKGCDKVFSLPVLENQLTNDYLKIIANKIGINAPVYFAYYQGKKKYN